ncbi:uncharacterized protein [Drosophila tropicalis]|uniref:uncharacterized protein n=1 Tax=Drosophila tropicalis TaxID=46794 RepID=UPI0035ABDC8F
MTTTISKQELQQQQQQQQQTMLNNSSAAVTATTITGPAISQTFARTCMVSVSGFNDTTQTQFDPLHSGGSGHQLIRIISHCDLQCPAPAQTLSPLLASTSMTPKPTQSPSPYFLSPYMAVGVSGTASSLLTPSTGNIRRSSTSDIKSKSSTTDLLRRARERRSASHSGLTRGGMRGGGIGMGMGIGGGGGAGRRTSMAL